MGVSFGAVYDMNVFEGIHAGFFLFPDNLVFSNIPPPSTHSQLN